jgi:hypothetical protein
VAILKTPDVTVRIPSSQTTIAPVSSVRMIVAPPAAPAAGLAVASVATPTSATAAVVAASRDLMLIVDIFMISPLCLAFLKERR